MRVAEWSLSGVVCGTLLLISGCWEDQTSFVPVRDLSQEFPIKRGGHRVQKGETLFLIAWSAGWDYRELAKANGIPSPYRIYVGQEISFENKNKNTWVRPVVPLQRKSNPLKEKTHLENKKLTFKTVSWSWPIRSFPIRYRKGARGLDINGTLGQPIYAAQSGTVVYAGNGLKAYGQLIIIRHSSGVMSAYAFNQHLQVQEGQAVQGGQEIAKMGSGKGQLGLLHFEVRSQGQVDDPLRYLPSIQ